MKTWTKLLGLALSAAAATWPLAAASVAVPIELRVVDAAGQPLDGVEARVEDGSGSVHTHRTTLLGEMALVLPAGNYVLTFSRSGFYDLVLEDFEIDPPEDPRELVSAFEPVRVMMHRRRGPDDDQHAESPPDAGIPDLEVSFRPRGRLFLHRPARGVFTLRNLGDEPLRLPLERRLHWTPEAHTLRLYVDIEGTEVAFDEMFVCPTREACRELAPQQSIEVPVQLNSTRSYSVGKSEATTWSHVGRFEGVAGVQLILPRAASAAPIRTRPVEVGFEVEVEIEIEP